MAHIAHALADRDARCPELSAAGAGARVPPGRLASLIAPLGAPWHVTLRVRGSGEDVSPAGSDGWVSMATFLAGLPARHAAAVAREADPRRQAADLLPWSLAVPASAYVLPAVLLDVLPATDPRRESANWLIHEHLDGYVDGVALPAGTQGRSRPTAVRVAASVASLVGPWLRRHVAVLPITERTAWGGVIDALTGCVLAAARDGLGGSQDRAWDGLQDLIDELGELAPLPRRPRRIDVAGADGPMTFPVRCTCCLHYRTHAAPDRDGDGYCVTCPLRTDASRHRRLAAHLGQATDAAS